MFLLVFWCLLCWYFGVIGFRGNYSRDALLTIALLPLLLPMALTVILIL